MIDYRIRIRAPASVVFDMLTDASLLTEWMAAEASSEPTPDGTFRWVYHNGDIVAGRYVELERPHRLVLAYGWERPTSRGIPPGSTRVEVTLAEAGGETLLELVHRGLPGAEKASHLGGWTHFLGRLASHVARTAGGTDA